MCHYYSSVLFCLFVLRVRFNNNNNNYYYYYYSGVKTPRPRIYAKTYRASLLKGHQVRALSVVQSLVTCEVEHLSGVQQQ